VEKGIVLGNPSCEENVYGREGSVCAGTQARHLFISHFGAWKEKLSIKIALQP
jgi:hypothetical protein